MTRRREKRFEEEGGRPAGIAAMKERATAVTNSRPKRRRREKRLEEEGGRPAGIAAMKERAMGLVCFVGRVLFASIFLLSAYQEASELGSDGGPAAKSLEPKFNLFVKHVSTKTGMAVPHVDIKTVIAVTVYLRAFGAGFFILYSRLGAFLLLVYITFITTVVSDFYNYERESPQFVQLHTQFGQNFALYGVLLFFWEMKNTITDALEEKDDKDRENLMEVAEICSRI